MFLSYCLCWCRFLLSLSLSLAPEITIGRSVQNDRPGRFSHHFPWNIYFHENFKLIPVCFSIRLRQRGSEADVGQAPIFVELLQIVY